MQLKRITQLTEMTPFWAYFETYMEELAKLSTEGEPIDLEYFMSSAYKEAIEKLCLVMENRIEILLLETQGQIMGFCMYDREANNAYIMEFGLSQALRGKGNGKAFYQLCEAYLVADHMESVSLTPTSLDNSRFWTAMGYGRSDDMDEDGKYIYTKSLLN